MARIFSIDFLHEGTMCHAMVTVRTTPFFTEYSLHIADEELAAMLPNNKIISATNGNYQFSDSASQNDILLMEELIHAIAGHMRALQA